MNKLNLVLASSSEIRKNIVRKYNFKCIFKDHRYDEENEKKSNQILDFTREIKNLSTEKKEMIIECLWSIIYSDTKSDMYESSLMRKLAGLIYFDNKKFGDIKEKVKNKIKK